MLVVTPPAGDGDGGDGAGDGAVLKERVCDAVDEQTGHLGQVGGSIATGGGQVLRHVGHCTGAGHALLLLDDESAPPPPPAAPSDFDASSVSVAYCWMRMSASAPNIMS